MYCISCGSKINRSEKVCPVCKTALKFTSDFKDEPNGFLSLLSFIFPIFGIVFYLAEKNKTPVRSKRYFKWSVASIILCVLIIAALVILGLTMLPELFSGVMELYKYLYEIKYETYSELIELIRSLIYDILPSDATS